MKKKYRYNTLSILNRIKLCWYILTGKEFYSIVVIDRYSDGKPLEYAVITNIKNNKTARIKLRDMLNNEIKYSLYK